MNFAVLSFLTLVNLARFRESALEHEPELLDIAQAAAFLRVSEKSLRRWTNAGRLPCFRVGGRRERRFRRADLLAFLERPGQTLNAGHVISHLCALYTSAEARERRAAEFLTDGLEAGSTCFLLAEPKVRERVLAQVARRRPSLRREAQTGRLVASSYAARPAAQLASWEAWFAEATGAGAASLWAVADVSGSALGRHSLDEVLEYEREYDRSLSRRFPVTTLCLYDARRLSGVQAARVLQVHGDMLRHPVEALVS
jgi:excisionase family DNA binding protein